jgi:hypothetical protein
VRNRRPARAAFEPRAGVARVGSSNSTTVWRIDHGRPRPIVVVVLVAGGRVEDVVIELVVVAAIVVAVDAERTEDCDEQLAIISATPIDATTTGARGLHVRMRASLENAGAGRPLC